MREYHEVRKGLNGDPADPASSEAAAPYVGVARTLLGQMKNQMRLGGLDHMTRTVNLPDGTSIQVLSSNGQDTIRITAAGTAPQAQEVEEFEPPTSEIPGIDLVDVEPPVFGPVGAFIVYKSAAAESLMSPTLPWRVDGKLYTTYPAGLIIRSGATMVVSPSATAPENDGVTIVLGLVVLDSPGGKPINTKEQPKVWKPRDGTDAVYLDVATIQGALPDSGPPYYAGAIYTVRTSDTNKTRFTATARSTAVTADLDIHTSGYEYTFIDYAPFGQTVASGVAICRGDDSGGGEAAFLLPLVGPNSSPSVPNPFDKSVFIQGAASFTINYDATGLPVPPSTAPIDHNIQYDILQSWNSAVDIGPLPTAKYKSVGEVLDTATNIRFPIGEILLQVTHTITDSRGGGTVFTASAAVAGYLTSKSDPALFIENVVSVIDADTVRVTFHSVAMSPVVGTLDGLPFSATNFGSIYSPWPTFVNVFGDAARGDAGVGVGNLAMQRKRIKVT